ncbi:MAG: hypothetical protein MUP47_08350 [Phycisphaerae bacterium]|nr:hypothetical protein [Phycisphaerae bacterium]
MVFRIRYRRQIDGQESEVAIEANTPTEALVKFRHTCGHAQGPATSPESVSSVPDEADNNEDCW